MNRYDPPPSAPPPPIPASASRPGRFSLWEMLVLITLVCVVGATIAWSRDQPEALFGVAISILVTAFFTLHVLTRSLAEAMAVTLGLLVLGFLLLPTHGGSPGAGRRMQCSNHLKQIGLALQNYHDTYGCFPPAYFADASGKPTHSWRVLLLPFMEQKPLYDKYRFDEPWDGPHNRFLHQEIVTTYACPSRSTRQSKNETSYVAVIGPTTLWPGTQSTRLSDVTDGTSNTLMVVEMANSGIHWMEPRDLDLATMSLAVNSSPGPSISSPHPSVAMAVFADGHTQAISKNTPVEIVRGLLTIAGQEQIGDY